MGRLAVLACLLLAAALPAEVAVAHDSVPADQLDAQNLRNVLLGRVTVWSNGGPVVLVRSREDDRALDAIAGRDLNRLLRGWKRLAFSGNGRMPTVEVDRAARKDWSVVRERVNQHGMRNSNTMAIAPTATISNITGVFQSIEPAYKHLFAKSNLSGEFTWVNTYLVDDLKRLGIWDEEIVDDLKYFDGSKKSI